MTVPVVTPVNTASEALEVSGILSQRINDRRGFIKTAADYYRGREGRMRFASDEFKDYFGKRFVGFSDNWCAPVAQAPVERIAHLGFRLDGATSADLQLARVWERSNAERMLSEALIMMTIAKRSFILTTPTPAGAMIKFENPDSAAVIYDPYTGARRAGLVITAGDKVDVAELHIPGWVIPVTRTKSELINGDRYVAPDVDGWRFDEKHEPRATGIDCVPLIELRNQALLDNDPISDISGVMGMQDTVNLVWAYQINGLDYASLPARVILNGEMPKMPILDEEGQIVGYRPIELDAMIRDRIAWLQGNGIKIDEWTPAQLDVYGKVIEQAIQHIASQTRTPGHYLLSGGNTPATGYESAEAGLVSKAIERTSYATPAIREAYRIAAMFEGMDEKSVERISTGKVMWRKPQYRTDSQLMDGLIKLKGAGFPFAYIAEEYGLSPDEVARVVQMKRDEMADPTFGQLQGAIDSEAGNGGTGF